MNNWWNNLFVQRFSLEYSKKSSTFLQQTLSTRSLDALFHIFALSLFSSIFDEVFTYSYFWDKRNNTNAEGVVKMKELLSRMQFTSQCLRYIISDTSCPRLSRHYPCFYASDKWSVTIRSVNQREITIGILYRTHGVTNMNYFFATWFWEWRASPWKSQMVGLAC